MEDAAIAGLARELRPRVLFENAETASGSKVDSLPATLFGDFARLRIARVDPGLDAMLSRTIKAIAATNHLKGLVLDLRFAAGEDYAAAGAAASVFLSQERPLLEWNGGSAKSAASPEAVSLPLVVLINKETTGAAEALAAVLRDARSGLLIGGRTAGQGVTYKEFALGGGRVLKIAGAPVEIPGQGPLPTNGLGPDIVVNTTPALERAYYADPYLASLQSSSYRPAPNSSFLDEDDLAASSHRVNEAELVRLQKAGVSPEEAAAGEAIPPRRLNEAELVREKRGGIAGPGVVRPRPVTDPALLRALDLLKGLSVVGSKPA
jgi:hypothetical protein